MMAWKEARVGELGHIITGKTPSKNSPKEWGDAIFFLTPTDYKNCHKYVKKTDRKLSKLGKVNHKARLLPKNSIMVTCIGSDMGKVLIATSDTVTNQQINSIIIDDDKYDVDFIYYMFLNMEAELKVLGGDGSAVPILNKSDFSNIHVNIPLLSEQRAIASVLSSLDDKIELLHRQNSTLEAMAEALFKQWFVVEAREDWEDCQIKDLFILQRGYDLPNDKRINGTIPIISSSGINDFHNSAMEKGPGVVIGRSGVLGNVFYIENDFWPLNTTLFIKEYKNSTPLFSYFLLKSLNLDMLNAGSAVPTLNRNHVHILHQKMPPLDLILKFENKVKKYFKKKQLNVRHISTLEKLRDTLLPKLMSGEVRVKF